MMRRRGVLLVDIARHVSRMFADQGLSSSEASMVRIHATWDAEIASPTDLGVTGPIS
jgi:hypothetical protein